MVWDFKCSDEVRFEMDLPLGLRRRLARLSVERNMDLQTLIHEILEGACEKDFNF